MLLDRDPALIELALPALAAMSDRYFRAEVEVVEHLSRKASLVVSTHNGGAAMPDTLTLMVAFWRRFGSQQPSYGLVHDAALAIPGLGDVFRKFGGLPAGHRSAGAVLSADWPLVLMPGGDLDALKPFRQRHQVIFGNRKGFIRLALRHQVPIIPVVSVGAHAKFVRLQPNRLPPSSADRAFWPAPCPRRPSHPVLGWRRR